MGEVFAGRYELVDPIGRGGVGAVWRAWDHRRRRYVAAKVLQQSDAHTLLRFVREQALRIDHPHVLAPTSWAADDDKVLFTMDLVSGGSLAHLIGDYGPLPPAFVCTLIDQLLAGLAAVHDEDVVHRDIKPANVLLEATGTRRPHLRLSDFGIAMRKGEPRLTDTNYVVGTPGYFAPEQIVGSEPDFPADLFAVGLVTLYLLQGAKPDAKALVDRFKAQGTPPAPKDISEPLWQVIATLLQPDPDARFRTATGARKALAAAAEMLPEPGPDDELVEVFDQIGPLPSGFGPDGPLPTSPAPAPPASGAFPRPPVHGPDPSHTGLPPAPIPPAAAPPRDEPGHAAQSRNAPQAAPPPAAPQAPAEPSPSVLLTPTPPPPPHPPLPIDPGLPQPPAAPPHPAPTPPASGQPPASTAGTAPTAPAQHETSPTRPYTGGQQMPLPLQAVPPTPQPQPPSRTGPAHASDAPRRSRRRAPRRKPGPPAKLAVPMLVVALLCIAFGVWALLQT